MITNIIDQQIAEFRKVGIVVLDYEIESLKKFTLVCAPKIPAMTNWVKFKCNLLDVKAREYFSIIMKKQFPEQDECYRYTVEYEI